MLLKGDVTIHAPRKKVWDFLTDPNQIGQCVPGVEKIETIEELKKYRGVVSVGLGSVKARFSGDVEILGRGRKRNLSLALGLHGSSEAPFDKEPLRIGRVA